MARTKQVTYNGKEYESIVELSRLLKIDHRKFYTRIRKYDGNVDMAVADLLSKTELIEEVKNDMDSLTNYSIPEEKEIIKENEEHNNLNEPSYTIRCMPKYIQAESIDQLIGALKNFDSDVVNLIDFENMKDANLNKYIKEEDINIFFYNATIHSNKFYKFTKNFKNTTIQVLIYDCIDQLVDNLIIYYLGRLQSKYPNKKYNIISKDTGFYRFIDYLNPANTKCIGMEFLHNKEDRFKYSLCKFISTTKLSHRNMVSLIEIPEIFQSFYDKPMTQEIIDDLFKSLNKFELIECKTKGQFEWVKFDMDKINKFLDEYQ